MLPGDVFILIPLKLTNTNMIKEHEFLFMQRYAT